MDSYDAIVYGSDLSTLIISTYIARKNKKVLYIDSKKRVGDYVNNFHMRRFDIEDTLDTLVCDDSKLIDIFKTLGLNITFKTTNEVYHVIVNNKERNERVEYILPKGIDNFINKVEEYIPNSSDSLKDFFDLALECKQAKNYLTKNQYDYKILKEKYPNFVKVLGNTVSDIFDELDIPILAQEILNVCWIYFSSTETMTSFIDYAIFLYDLVEYNTQIPSISYNRLCSLLLDEFLKYKGDYLNGGKIDKILTVGKRVNGVSIDNKIYYTNKFITSINPDIIYNDLIIKNEIPTNALKLNSKRVVDGNKLTIYVGLNRTVKQLELNSYKYFLYKSLDTDVEYKNMSSINNTSSIVTIPSVINKVSPEGTSVMIFNTVFFNESFSKYIDVNNYHNSIMEIANNIITNFENSTGKRIRDYIEEIKIFTPVDYEIKYNDSNYFGYILNPLDDTIIRSVNINKESYIKGLYICGKYGVSGGISSNIIEHAIILGKNI